MATMRLLCAVLFLWMGAAHAIDVPELVPNVVDTTGTLTESEIHSLNETITSLRTHSQIWAAILVVSSINGESIEQTASEVFERWELGKRNVDNGLLILVAKNDRKVRIEVGYGLEGAITDAQASRIIRDIITPQFKEGRFFDGLNAALIVSRDLAANGQSPLLAGESSQEKEKSYVLPVVIWFVLIVVLPIVMRIVAVRKSLNYRDELQASLRESKWWRLLFLSGVSSFLTVFLLINPGIFFVVGWYKFPFVTPVFILFAYLFLTAANWGYIAMLSERRRGKFRNTRSGAANTYDAPQAYDAGLSSSSSGSSSSGSSSSSHSSSSSSSSGGGRSGGGGASGSW